MTERADALPAGLARGAEAEDLTREFELRLADSSVLAFRVAYSVLRHRQDAEDVAQEAFARAYRRFADLRDREKFRAWLVRMTWRMAIDWRRGDRRRATNEMGATMDFASSAPSVEADAIAREQSDRLWVAIDALPEKLRVTTVLAAIEGHSVKDVAALLGVPEGTVKFRLFAARQKLQERLR
jgi:RNA polymerase sigma-70 factor (ECF subfamily)